VGDRVIARRNDRGRDLDNGTRGTIMDVDLREGLRIRTDSGAIRQIDGEYVSQHVEYAYALTGHGMQGGTVEWAAVVGRPDNFTRNWSYTAITRAREPTEILLIDEPSRAHEDRAQIAPATNIVHHQGPVERMAARMRERDDEDLAVEQLGQAIPDVAERGAEASDALASPGVVRMRELEREIALVNAQLGALPTDDVKRYVRIQDAIASLQAHRARFGRRGEWRERGERKSRAKQLDRDLRQFEEQRDELLARTPDPEAVRGRADELKKQRHKLSEEHRVLRHQVIGEELGRRPEWLESSLGPEPENPRLRDRWHRTARQVSSYRLDHDISDPENALGPEPDTRTPALAVQRAISETRAHLGLELPGPEPGRGYDIDA
jgi:hypothetical protein